MKSPLDGTTINVEGLRPRGRRAALYARVSGDKQREEATIKSQVAEIERAIVDRGDTLVSDLCFKDEGYTGTLLARPALDQLRDAARRGSFDVLYVYDRGRLSRRFAHQELIIEELTDLDIQFVTLHDAPAETAEDQVLQAMQGVFHEYDRIRIAERFRRGRMYKVRSGKILGYEGKYGYTYVRKSQTADGHFAINPEEAEVVTQIFRWYGTEGVTMREIVKRLLEAGQRPRRSPRGVWHISTIHSILRDEIYVGRHYYNKTEAVAPRPSEHLGRYRRVKKDQSRVRPRSEWIVIPVPAIIDQDLFDSVQKRRALNAVRSPRNAKHDYLLRGLVRCPCGSGRHVRRCAKTIPVYTCGNPFANYPRPATCRRGYVRADVADAAIWHRLKEAITDPAFLQEQAERWLGDAQSNSGQRDNRETLAKLDRSLQGVYDEEARYARAYGVGDLPEPLFRELSSEVRSKREHLERERRVVEELSDQRPRPTTVEEVVVLAVAGASRLTFEDRARLVGVLVESVVMDRTGAIVTGHFPLRLGQDTRLVPGNMISIEPNDPSSSPCRKPGRASSAVAMPFTLTVDFPVLTRSKRYFQRAVDEFIASLASQPKTTGEREA